MKISVPVSLTSIGTTNFKAEGEIYFDGIENAVVASVVSPGIKMSIKNQLYEKDTWNNIDPHFDNHKLSLLRKAQFQ